MQEKIFKAICLIVSVLAVNLVTNSDSAVQIRHREMTRLLQPRNGPIGVTLEWRISQQLTLMNVQGMKDNVESSRLKFVYVDADSIAEFKDSVITISLRHN